MTWLFPLIQTSVVRTVPVSTLVPVSPLVPGATLVPVTTLVPVATTVSGEALAITGCPTPAPTPPVRTEPPAYLTAWAGTSACAQKGTTGGTAKKVLVLYLS